MGAAEILKIDLHEIIQKWVESSTQDRADFYLKFIESKFGNKDQGYRYTLSMLSTLETYHKKYQEVRLLQRLIHDPKIDKNMARGCIKLKNFYLQRKNMVKSTNPNLDLIFLDRPEIISACEKIFPTHEDMYLEIIRWIKSENARLKTIKRTDKALASMLLANIRPHSVSLSYFLEHVLDMLIARKEKELEAMKVENEQLLGKLEDIYQMQTMDYNCPVNPSKPKTLPKNENSTKRFNPAEDVVILDEIDEDPTQFQKTPYQTMIDEYINQKKPPGDEHLTIDDKIEIHRNLIHEKKDQMVKEIKEMYKSMGERKHALANMLGMAKAMDPSNTHIQEKITEMIGLMNEGKRHVTSDIGQGKLFECIGTNGHVFLRNGTFAKANLYEHLRYHYEINHTELFKQICGKGNNMAAKLKHKLAEIEKLMDKDGENKMFQRHINKREELNKQIMEDYNTNFKGLQSSTGEDQKNDGPDGDCITIGVANVEIGKNPVFENSLKKDITKVYPYNNEDGQETSKLGAETPMLETPKPLDFLEDEIMVFDSQEEKEEKSEDHEIDDEEDEFDYGQREEVKGESVEESDFDMDQEDMDLIKEEEQQELELKHDIEDQNEIEEPLDLPVISDWKKWGNLTKKDAKWVGWYVKNHKDHPMIFENLTIGFDGKVSGWGVDNGIKFDLKGKLNDKSLFIEITKTYINDKSEIFYKGVLSNKSISGVYTNKVKGDTGMFEVDFASTHWEGDWKFGRKAPGGDQNFSLHVDEDGIFGIGEDDKGKYLIRGDYNRNYRTARFVQKYIGVSDEDICCFTGVADEVNHDFIIEGVWQKYIDESQSGVFKINGQLWPGPVIKKKNWWDWGQNENLKAKWLSWYQNEDEGDLPNRHDIHNLQVSLFDYSIDGDGEDATGEFSISGKIIRHGKKNKVELVKTYENGQTQVCKGKLNGYAIEGTWDSGSENRIKFAIESMSPDFTGFISDSFNQKHGLAMRMYVSTQGIFGMGEDEKGCYVVRGDIDKQDRSCRFAMQHMALNSMVFNGRFNIHDGMIIMRGVYETRDLTNKKIVLEDGGGFFELSGNFGETPIHHSHIRHLNSKRKIPLTQSQEYENIGLLCENNDHIQNVLQKSADSHKIRWEGTYTIGNGATNEKFEEVFENMYMDDEGNIEGGGDDSGGKYEITGILYEHEWCIYKAYTGKTVNYNGIQGKEGVVSGTWEVNGNENEHGGFTIEMKVPIWTGTMTQEGSDEEPKEIELHISFTELGIFGIGSDENGDFACTGTFHQGIVSFKKNYIGEPDVYFNGARYEENGILRIEGDWTYEGTNGTFEINRHV